MLLGPWLERGDVPRRYIGRPMSSKLSSVLVQTEAVPVRKVEEAIQRQVIYGGSLGTNLLEMGALGEEQLLSCLARATDLDYADYRWIHHPDPEAQKAFPRKLVERYRMIPVNVHGSVLRGMVEAALDPSVLEELSFMLGQTLRTYILPEIRFAQALEQHFGIPLRPRFRNLLRKLDQGLAYSSTELRSLTEEAAQAAAPPEEGWDELRPTPYPDRRPTPRPVTLTREIIGTVPSTVTRTEAFLAAGVPPLALEDAPYGESELAREEDRGEDQYPTLPMTPAVAQDVEQEAQAAVSDDVEQEAQAAVSDAVEQEAQAAVSDAVEIEPLAADHAADEASAVSEEVGERDVGAEWTVAEVDEAVPPEEPDEERGEEVVGAAEPLFVRERVAELPAAGTRPPADRPQAELDTMELPAFGRARRSVHRGMRHAAPTEAGAVEPGPRARPPGAAAMRLSLEAASTELTQRDTRDGLLEVALAFLSQRGDNVYILVVKRGQARCHMGLSPEAGPALRLGDITLELPEGSLLGRVTSGRQHHLGPFGHDEPSRLFYTQLDRSLPKEGLVLPVVIRDRTVLLILVDRGQGPLDPILIPQSLIFVQRLARSLERLILQRKRAGTGPVGGRPAASMFSMPALPASDEPPRAVEPGRPSRPETAPGPEQGSPAPSARPVDMGSEPLAATTPASPTADELPTAGSPYASSSPDKKAVPGPSPELPRISDLEPPRNGTPLPSLELESPSLAQGEGREPDAPGCEPVITPADRSEDRQAEAEPEGDAPAEPSDAPRGLSPSWPSSPDEPALGVGRVSSQPIELTRVRSPSGRPISSEVRQEQRSFSSLVAQLHQEETRGPALGFLRAMGLQALDVCMLDFPGPILIDREALIPGRYPPVEEHGPLLALLVELGPAVLPDVCRELDSPVIANRFYSTLLVGRIGDAGAIEVLVERLYDGVALVRQAASEALGRYIDTKPFELVRARICSDLMMGEGEQIRWAAEAAGWFKEPEAVEHLCDLVRDKDPMITEAVNQALQEITRHDFGRSARAWKRWYRKNVDRKRIEWLIDALVQDDLELRTLSAEELHHISGQRIPFDVKGPKRERKRVQAEWRRWYKQARKQM